MIIKNFALGKIKKELSPHLDQLKGSVYTQLIKKLYLFMDELLMQQGSGTHQEYFTDKQRKVISTIYSFLAHEGLSHVSAKIICKKASVSYPTFKIVVDKLEELGLIQIKHCKKFGQQSANLYLLTLHPNYLDILKYLEEHFSLPMDFDQNFHQIFDRFLNRLNSENPYPIKENKENYESNELIEFNSFKEKDIDLHVTYETSSSTNLFKEKVLDNEKVEYCEAAGVPTELSQILGAGLSVLEIVNVWGSIQRTLNKYKASFDEYCREIISAVRRSIIKYKQIIRNKPGIQFDFAGCICGYIKKYVLTQPTYAPVAASNTSRHTGTQSIEVSSDMPSSGSYTHSFSYKRSSKAAGGTMAIKKPKIEIVKKSAGVSINHEEYEEVLKMAREMEAIK